LPDAAEPKVPSYMTQAVWATVLCFPPTGAWAIVQASRVITLLDEGDLEGALRASRSARYWIRVSIILGALVLLGTIAIGAAIIVYVGYYLIPGLE
jgi:hypothetical protein